MSTSALVPPFSRETAVAKVRAGENLWNTCDPARVALGYTPDSWWRNRSTNAEGREQIVECLTTKWEAELDYRLIKELWAYGGGCSTGTAAIRGPTVIPVSATSASDRGDNQETRVPNPRTRAGRVNAPTMRAVGVTEYGGPDVLELVELPRPSAGPGQIRIRVHAATVNPGDTLLRIGDLDEVLRNGPLKPPYVPGMEAAGVVDQIGQGAQTDLRVGDRVMAVLMPIDATGGAYAEYLVADADQAARAPAGTTHVEAATLPMNGLTARLALDVLNVAPGETVAVTGSAGAVGGYAIQLAKVDGLRVIADAAASDETLVATLGADQIVARGADVGQRIRQWWPDGVAAVVDGSLQGPAVVPAIRDGGQVASVRGWELHGSSGLGEDRGITVRDVFVPEYTHRSDKLDELRVLTEEGKLTLRVARTYPAAEAAEAHRALEAGGVRGRLVLTFD